MPRQEESSGLRMRRGAQPRSSDYAEPDIWSNRLSNKYQHRSGTPGDDWDKLKYRVLPPKGPPGIIVDDGIIKKNIYGLPRIF